MYRTTLKWMRESRLPYMASVAAELGIDMTGWTFGRHFGLSWTLVNADMRTQGTWKTLNDAERGTDDMIRAWFAAIEVKDANAKREAAAAGREIVTVYGYRRLNNSVNGNPRFALIVDGGELTTSSDAACSYGIENGWTVNHTTKGERVAYMTFTRAGRVATLEWADGDN
jgi:hypothetical protein